MSLQSKKLKDYQIEFDAVDSWFFRESRPHDAAGAARLSSLFPPPARTLAGAVKTLLGNSLGVNWQQFAKGSSNITVDGHDLYDWLNKDITFGSVRLVREKESKREILYPAPLCVLAYGDEPKKLVRLQPGEPVRCDLGMVRLPELAHKADGAAPLEKTWVTADGLARILAGGELDGIELISESDLVTFEPRLGIGRDNCMGTVRDGLLYQTSHVRLKPGVVLSIEAHLPEGLAAQLQTTLTASAIQRVGGEGRMAHLSLYDGSQPLPKAPKANGPAKGLMLMLLNDAAVSGAEAPLPGFTPTKQGDVDMWRGAINGIELVLECCVVGKAVRRGGWDLQKSLPAAVRSLTPAGSCYFVHLDGEAHSLDQAIEQLHGKTINTGAADQQLGQILCGLWT